MRYALVIYDPPHAPQPSGQRALHAEYQAIARTPGLIAHYRLATPGRAATVRVEDGQRVVVEGPHAETALVLRAIYLIDDDRDRVLELAAAMPAACSGGAVEVWPISEPGVARPGQPN